MQGCKSPWSKNPEMLKKNPEKEYFPIRLYRDFFYKKILKSGLFLKTYIPENVFVGDNSNIFVTSPHHDSTNKPFATSRIFLVYLG